MIQKIKAMIVKYWEVLIYLVFGVLTTVVNYVIYLPVYNILGLSAALSNAIAWVGAVAFAYLTNKPFVFKSHDWSAKTVVPELAKFVGCRVGEEQGQRQSLVGVLLSRRIRVDDLLRPARHRQNHGRTGHRRRAFAVTLSRESGGGREQIHRRDREKPR